MVAVGLVAAAAVLRSDARSDLLAGMSPGYVVLLVPASSGGGIFLTSWSSFGEFANSAPTTLLLSVALALTAAATMSASTAPSPASTDLADRATPPRD